MPEYIEREAFEEDVRLRYCKDCTKRQHEIYCRSCWVDDMLGEVEDAPAADVEAVRHGEWVLKDDNGNGVCNQCNRQDQVDPLATHFRYCGAKMDGKGET